MLDLNRTEQSEGNIKSEFIQFKFKTMAVWAEFEGRVNQTAFNLKSQYLIYFHTIDKTYS